MNFRYRANRLSGISRLFEPQPAAYAGLIRFLPKRRVSWEISRRGNETGAARPSSRSLRAYRSGCWKNAGASGCALALAVRLKRMLSNRETDVLKVVAEGLSNKEIARRLGISENTVRNHLVSIFDKLKATNRTHAVMLAIRLGLQIP